MAPKRKQKSQGSLLQSFWPLLPKPAAAGGKFADVVGKYWDGCPLADRTKIFKCIVVEFAALHDFGGKAGFLISCSGLVNR